MVVENQKTLGQSSELVRQAEGRLAAQEVIESDVLQARVSDQQARRAVMEAEISRDAAKARLAIVLDYLPEAGFAVKSAASGKSAAQNIREALVLGQQGREEIHVAQETLHMTQAERDEIRARFAPTMDLQFGRDFATGSTVDRRESWNTGISFSWSIFDRGQRQLDLRDNRLQQAQNDLRLQQAAKTVATDVVDAWFAIERYRKRLASLAIERQAAEANYDVKQANYKVGLATVLDVQTALRDLARVRIEFTNSTFDLEVAYRELENVTASYEAPRIDAATKRLQAARPARFPFFQQNHE